MPTLASLINPFRAWRRPVEFYDVQDHSIVTNSRHSTHSPSDNNRHHSPPSPSSELSCGGPSPKPRRCTPTLVLGPSFNGTGTLSIPNSMSNLLQPPSSVPEAEDHPSPLTPVSTVKAKLYSALLEFTIPAEQKVTIVATASQRSPKATNTPKRRGPHCVFNSPPQYMLDYCFPTSITPPSDDEADEDEGTADGSSSASCSDSADDTPHLRRCITETPTNAPGTVWKTAPSSGDLLERPLPRLDTCLSPKSDRRLRRGPLHSPPRRQLTFVIRRDLREG